MGKITADEVEKLARLARLGLSEKEKEVLALQMSEILGFAENLNEIEVNNVEPTSQVTGAVNVFREDEINDCDISRAELLKKRTTKRKRFYQG